VEPGHDLAVYLAKRGIDVWGLDRRWTTAPATGADFSDFADMDFATGVADVRRALLFSRASRALTGSGSGRLVLGGFSSGGHLAYAYAEEESQRPTAQRHVKGLVPIDIYARIAPEDEALRQRACASRDEGRALVAAGLVDSDNSAFFQPLGALAASDPDAPSPLFEGYTNESALFTMVAQTYFFYGVTPDYHLVAGVLTDGAPTALRYSSKSVIADWLAYAPPHQAFVEGVDGDALWCGEAPLPIADHLADIQVPLFYLGAAGGFGDYGLYTTTLVGSSDVTTHVVRRLAADRELEDFGHADLLYADDAPALAWKPLAAWLLSH
jgi:hypothetical protein